MKRGPILLLSSLLCACGPSQPQPAGTVVLFDLQADLTQSPHFYDFPWPSDLRLNATGGPDLDGFPSAATAKVVTQLRDIAGQRGGFPVVPVAYFKFSAPLAPLDSSHVIAADPSSPLLLVDVDASSPARGKLFPTVATTPPTDDYVPDNLLAVAARPGFVLAPKRRYAFVVMRSLGDAAGQPLGLEPSLEQLKQMQLPDGAKAAAARDLFAPLWQTLATAGIDAAQVAAATVFTTGDVVAETFDLTTALLAKYSVQITNLTVDPDDGASADRLCMLVGTVSYPQFQKGTPPFNSDGLFDFSDGGLPAHQRDEVAPITLSIPNGTMPGAGYPLEIFFHGSGGLSTNVVDRGPVLTPDGMEQKGRGPAYVLAPFGIAAAGSAMPLNPERLPGASDLAYLNFNNLAAFRDTFRQGVIEQRLFIEALRTLEIPAATVAGACPDVALPAGASSLKFDPSHLVAQGQSMGGMYTNLISAVEPRIQAAVPTGAGGFWSYFILTTRLVAKAAQIIGPTLLATDAELSFMHPALQLLETAWEPAEPFASMPRLAFRPLPGHPVRPIYEPVGQDDIYFAEPIYDAAALAYGNHEAGDLVWPGTQTALALDHRDGLVPYPVSGDARSDGSEGASMPYTGVVVQYKGDGIADAHYIFAQLDAVKYQYGCFLSSFLQTGAAVVPAPQPLGTPCPK